MTNFQGMLLDIAYPPHDLLGGNENDSVLLVVLIALAVVALIALVIILVAFKRKNARLSRELELLKQQKAKLTDASVAAHPETPYVQESHTAAADKTERNEQDAGTGADTASSNRADG